MGEAPSGSPRAAKVSGRPSPWQGAPSRSFYSSRRPGLLLTLAAGVHLGGAVSNLGDRLISGSVTDFFVAGPIVLNLADLALVAGTAMAVLALSRDPDDQMRKPLGEMRERA